MSVVKGIANEIISLAAKASPANVQLFQMAMDDLQGVIGQRCVPIVDLFRDGVRLVGDVLQSILPNMSDMRDALAPLRQSFAEIRSAIEPLAPIIKDVIMVSFNMLAMTLKGLAVSITMALAPLNAMMEVARDIGLLGKPEALKSSVGAAAKPASYSSIADVAKNAQQRAFSQGYGPNAKKESTPIKQLVETAKDILAWLTQKKEQVEAAKETVSNAADIATNAAGWLAKRAMDAIGF